MVDEAKKDKRIKLSPEMIEWVTSKETLKQHTALTLAERAVMLHRQFPETRVSESALSRLFKKEGVKKKAIVKKKRVKWGQKGEVKQEIEDAKTNLMDYLLRDYLVVWLDECMLTTKTYQNTDWSRKNTNQEVDARYQNMQSTAFLGAVA